jgi:ribosome biogenesis GTPase A
MNKIFKKHKSLPVTYLYVIDILDIAGSFKKYVFNRLVDQQSQIFIVVNKLDIANEKYLNRHFVVK